MRDPGKIYDRFTAEAGPQTISREDFIAEIKRITDPVEFCADLAKMMRIEDWGRQEKGRIDAAINP